MSGAFDRHRAALAAALGTLALLLGLVPASGTLARDRETGVQAMYDCMSGAVRSRVIVDFTAAYPQGGRPGQPLWAEGFAVRPELTSEAVAALLPAGTTELSGTARLAVEVAQNGRMAEADWPGLVAPRVVPDAGAPRPVFAGEVPTVTVAGAGEVSLTAGELALTLLPSAGATSAPASGTPDAPTPSGASTPSAGPSPAPGPVELRCSPEAAPGPRLAAWPVAESANSGPPDAPTATPAQLPSAPKPPAPPIQVGPGGLGQAPVCPADLPPGELDRTRLPQPPPGATESRLDASLCVVAVGYATVAKLGSALVINDPHGTPGLLHLDLGKRTVSAPDYDESDSVGILGFPDAEATFLAFGFQPTTAKVHFEPEPVTVVNIRRGTAFTTAIAYRQYLRLYDLRVNGVPMDVGPRCRTSRPIDTVLAGAYDFLTGGVLDGKIAIPPFAGCVSRGEDLSPLFTATLSGPGNPVRIRQGRLAGAGSAPPVPELPKR
ncbi:DUF6801 domain-containing protein [Streptomyces sp. NPDC048696]|uniref:DUF6801 domain-containing protein n=1 Tax=Streptomyces sp. NPDC048696 TaxID=3365585 RepID=UPI00371C147B